VSSEPGAGQTTTAAQSALADASYLFRAVVTDAAGNSATSNAISVVVDTAAPTIGIGTIAGDNIVDAGEASAGFAISGTESGADGQTVTVTIVDSSSTVVDTYTTTAAGGTWSVNVTSAQAQALTDGSYIVTAAVSDAAGNPARVASQAITAIASTFTIAGTATYSLHGGTLTADFIEIMAGGTLVGPGTITASVIQNDGTMLAHSNSSPLTINISGNITGTGILEITNQTTLILNGPVGSGQTVVFDIGGGTAGELDLSDPSNFYGQIEGFTGADRIDLTNINFVSGTTTWIYTATSANTGTLTISQGPTPVF
jgi:hypothetical protein